MFGNDSTTYKALGLGGLIMANFKRRPGPSINCSCSPFIHRCDYPILPLVILIWIKYIKSLFVSWRININNLAKVHLEETLDGQLRQDDGPAGEAKENPEDLFEASLKPLHSMAGHWGLAEEGVVREEDLLPENTIESTSLSSHTSPVRYIDMTYRLSIYRHFWKISIWSFLKISISISISIRQFWKISISISISIRQFQKYRYRYRYRYGDFGKYRYRYRYR